MERLDCIEAALHKINRRELAHNLQRLGLILMCSGAFIEMKMNDISLFSSIGSNVSNYPEIL